MAILAITGLYVFLWFLGLGSVGAMGLSERTLTSGPATIYLLIDLRLFAYIEVLVAALKILTSTLDLKRARREATQQPL